MTVWVRVRSLATGAQFDVSLQAFDRLLHRGAVEEIPGRRVRATSARPHKSFTGLDGRRRYPSPAAGRTTPRSDP